MTTMWTPPVRTVRTAAAGTALVLGCLLAAAAILVGLTNREVLDSGRFARHVDAIRSDPAVASQVGEAITTQVLRLDRDLVALKPAIEATATTVVRSSAFTPIVTAAARQLHTALTRPRSGQLVLRLADVGAVVVPLLRALAPNLARALPPDFDVTLARIGAQDFAGRTITFAHRIRLLSWLLPLLAAACFAAAWALSHERRRMISRFGVAISLAGVLVGTALLIASAVVAGMSSDTLQGAVVHAAWRQLTGSAPAAVVGVVLAGALIVAAAGARVDAGRLTAMRAGMTRWGSTLLHRSQESRATRLIAAAVLAAIGAVLVLRPLPTLRVLALVSGVALLMVAALQLAAEAPAPAAKPARPAGRTRRRAWVAAGAVGTVGVLLLGALVAAGARPTLGDDPPAPVAAPGRTCNGYLALCDRSYDQVAFPATHNSMAAADQPGWLFAEQPDGIISQLDAGVRALLIDAWLGQPTRRADIVTTPAGPYHKALSASNQDLGKETVASALRVRDLLRLTPTGPARPYLCHGLCELGATPWEPVMAQVKDWMVAHPRNVVTLIVQDEDVTPEQTATVFQQAGLLPFVHTQRPGQPWPTLGQMIRSGHRLVVFMENQDGGTKYPWEMPAFTWMQDTPFTFRSADQFTCARLRGEPSSPLLLVNHWLSNAARRVSDSAAVNSQDVLWPRVSECREQRHHIPNFVAVNFYNEGDLFTVVDQLNGVA